MLVDKLNGYELSMASGFCCCDRSISGPTGKYRRVPSATFGCQAIVARANLGDFGKLVTSVRGASHRGQIGFTG